MKERLEKMLNVEIIRIEEAGDKIVVYVPADKVRIAVGSGGAAVKAPSSSSARRSRSSLQSDITQGDKEAKG